MQRDSGDSFRTQGSYWPHQAFTSTVHSKKCLANTELSQKGEREVVSTAVKCLCHVASCVAPCLLAMELWPDRATSQSQSSRKCRPEQATKLNPLNSSPSRVGVGTKPLGKAMDALPLSSRKPRPYLVAPGAQSHKMKCGLLLRDIKI